MVATCNINLSAPRSSGLSPDHFSSNMGVLATGKLPGMVTHGTGALYCWRGWTLGTAHPSCVAVVILSQIEK